MLQKYKKTTKKYFNSFQIYFTFIDFQKCLINCCCQRKAIKKADFISFLSNLAPFVIEIQSIIYLTYAELCVRISFSLLLLRNHIKRGRRLLEFPREKKAKQTIATTTIAATNKPQTAKKFARRQTRRARVQKTKRVKVKDNKKKQQKKSEQKTKPVSRRRRAGSRTNPTAAAAAARTAAATAAGGALQATHAPLEQFSAREPLAAQSTSAVVVGAFVIDCHCPRDCSS